MISNLTHKHAGYGTWPGLIKHVDVAVGKFLDSLKEILFCVFETIDDCKARIFREFRVSDDKLMQVVSQEVSAWIPTMAIEDAKESTLGPVVTFFTGWLHNVKNNGHSVLVVIPDYTLISICCVTRNYPVLSYRAFCLFKIGQDYCIGVRVWGVAEKKGIDVSHARWSRSTGRIVVWGMCLQGLSKPLWTLTGWDAIRESVFNLIVWQGAKSVLWNLSVRSHWCWSTNWWGSLQNLWLHAVSTATIRICSASQTVNRGARWRKKWRNILICV